MALMNFVDAKANLQDPHSCFKLANCHKHLTLPPKFLGNVKQGIQQVLDSELKLFSDRLNGVPITYSNIKTLTPFGMVMDEQPVIHFDIQADFIIFQPSIGSILKGVVNKKSVDHIGCLVHGCFNASLLRPRFGADGDAWTGTGLMIGDEFLFEVTRIDANQGVISIKGKLCGASLDLQATKRSQKRSRLTSSGSTGGVDLNGLVEIKPMSDEEVDTETNNNMLKKIKKEKFDEAYVAHSPHMTPIDLKTLKNEPPSSDEEAKRKKKKKKDKKRKANSEEECDEESSNVKLDLSRLKTEPASADEETTKNKKKKDRKRKANGEQADAEESMDFEPDLSRVKSLKTEPASADEDRGVTKKKKKKDKKNKADGEQEESLLVTPDLSRVKSLKSEPASSDEDGGMTKKKKKKDKKRKANGEQVFEEEISDVKPDLSRVKQEFMNIKQELDTSNAPKKKKKKDKVKEEINMKQEFDTLSQSLHKKKMKKEKHRETL